jgi:AbrB family looped-hinge helix DNA binding protein
MRTAVAKITAKGQTTIPVEIRTGLHAKPGDLIAWELLPDGTARVRRIEPLDLAYLDALEGTLGEWSGAADEEAYRDL